MALMTMKRGGENCDRILYVEVIVGEQIVYCYLCNSANQITFKPDDTDSD